MEVVDTILIKRFQKFQSPENILNPVDIDIQPDKLWNFASCYKEKVFSYRFIIGRLLFSANITENIFITCNGLNDTKTTIVHDKDYKILRVLNLGKITNWLSVKESPIWVEVNFVDRNYLTEGNNFAFVYTSKNLNDLTKFTFELRECK